MAAGSVAVHPRSRPGAGHDRGHGRGLPGHTVAGRAPDASSTCRIIQQVGASFGSAILALILARALASHPLAAAATRALAFHTAFWWAIALTALALIPAVLLPGRIARARRAEAFPETPQCSRPVGGRSYAAPKTERNGRCHYSWTCTILRAGCRRLTPPVLTRPISRPRARTG